MKKERVTLLFFVLFLPFLTGCLNLPLENAEGKATYDISDGKVRMADVIVGTPTDPEEKADWLADCTGEYRLAVEDFAEMAEQMKMASQMTMQNMSSEDIAETQAQNEAMDSYVNSLRKGTCVAEEVEEGNLRLTISNTFILRDLIGPNEQNTDGSYPLDLGFLGGDHQVFTGVTLNEIWVKCAYEITNQSSGYTEEGGFFVYKHQSGEMTSKIQIHMQIPEEDFEAAVQQPEGEESIPEDSPGDDTEDNGQADQGQDPAEQSSDQDSSVNDENKNSGKSNEYEPEEWFNPANVPDMTLYLMIAGGAVVAVLIVVIAFKMFSAKKDRKLEKIAKEIHKDSSGNTESASNQSKAPGNKNSIQTGIETDSSQADTNAQKDSFGQASPKNQEQFDSQESKSNESAANQQQGTADPKQNAANIIPYIRDNLHKGYKPSEIRDALIKSGWSEQIIDEAFERVL